MLPEDFPHKNRIPGLSYIKSALLKLAIPYEIVSIPSKRKGEKTVWKILEQENVS